VRVINYHHVTDDLAALRKPPSGSSFSFRIALWIRPLDWAFTAVCDIRKAREVMVRRAHRRDSASTALAHGFILIRSSGPPSAGRTILASCISCHILAAATNLIRLGAACAALQRPAVLGLRNGKRSQLTELSGWIVLLTVAASGGRPCPVAGPPAAPTNPFRAHRPEPTSSASATHAAGRARDAP